MNKDNESLIKQIEQKIKATKEAAEVTEKIMNHYIDEKQNNPIENVDYDTAIQANLKSLDVYNKEIAEFEDEIKNLMK